MTSRAADLSDAIAQAGRILVGHGLLDAFGHVSARLPGSTDRFLMSRSLAPALVTANDILELDRDGNCPAAPQARLFLERFLHAAIYRARPDVEAIVHSHSPEVVAFTVVPGATLRPICHVCGFLADTPAPFDAASVAGDGSDLLIRDMALGAALASHLGQAAVVPMRAHGFTTVGTSIAEATFRAIYTARNCRIELDARKLGEPTWLSRAEAAACETTTRGQADRAWEVWRRELAVELQGAAHEGN